MVVTSSKFSVRSFSLPLSPPIKVPFVPVRTVAALNVTGLWYVWLPRVVTLAEQGRANNREVVDAVAVASDGGLSCKVERQVIAVTDK